MQSSHIQHTLHLFFVLCVHLLNDLHHGCICVFGICCDDNSHMVCICCERRQQWWCDCIGERGGWHMTLVEWLSTLLERPSHEHYLWGVVCKWKAQWVKSSKAHMVILQTGFLPTVPAQCSPSHKTLSSFSSAPPKSCCLSEYHQQTPPHHSITWWQRCFVHNNFCASVRVPTDSMPTT